MTNLKNLFSEQLAAMVGVGDHDTAELPTDTVESSAAMIAAKRETLQREIDELSAKLSDPTQRREAKQQIGRLRRMYDRVRVSRPSTGTFVSPHRDAQRQTVVAFRKRTGRITAGWKATRKNLKRQRRRLREILRTSIAGQ